MKLAGTGRAVTDFKQAIASPEVDAVIVATFNSVLAEVSAAAIRAGKPVLVEKPAGVSVKQIDELIALAEQARCLRAGGFQSPLSSGVYQGAGNFRVRRDGGIDVHPGALRPRRSCRLRQGMARQSETFRRRRID